MDAQTYINLNTTAQMEYINSATGDELNAIAANIQTIIKGIDMKTEATYLDNKRRVGKLTAMTNTLRSWAFSK